MTIIGYAVILSYVFFLIFAVGPAVKKRTNQETSRKIIHTALFMVWVFIDIFFRLTVHQIIVPVVFLILNALSYKFDLYKSVERQENNHMGTIFFAIAILVVMTIAYFQPDFYLPSGVAAFCLTLGDGMAALVGYNTQSPLLRAHKSVNGFLACALSSALALVFFRLVWWPDLPWADIALLAVFCAVMELTEKGWDNFTVTWGVFGMSYLMRRLPDADLRVALIYALAVFLIVCFSRAIDYPGSLLAMVIVFCFRFFGGISGIVFLLGTYFTIFGINKIAKAGKGKADRPKAERGWRQILINGGLGTLFMILYGTTKQDWCRALSLVSVAGCFIDSISSDIGSLSPRLPYDFLRGAHVPAGLSGGVTALGTLSALAFSLLIGLYAHLCVPFSLVVSALIAGFSFLQTILDTVMGSLLQVKYQCGGCGALTERKEHCRAETVYFSGVRWIDNNVVNLFSSMLVTAAAGGVLRLVL